MGPWAVILPLFRSRMWVAVGGISSTWWVTSSMVRLGSSCVSETSKSSLPCRSSPAVGSSRISSSGSAIRVRASRIRWRSPDEQLPKGAVARLAQPSSASKFSARSRSELL